MKAKIVKVILKQEDPLKSFILLKLHRNEDFTRMINDKNIRNVFPKDRDINLYKERLDRINKNTRPVIIELRLKDNVDDCADLVAVKFLDMDNKVYDIYKAPTVYCPEGQMQEFFSKVNELYQKFSATGEVDEDIARDAKEAAHMIYGEDVKLSFELRRL